MKCLLATALALAVVMPAHAGTPLLNTTMEGKWALGSAASCGVPSKTYVLAMVAENDNIVWQDGLGNMDIERVIYNGMYEFRTVTMQSMHQGRSRPVGTGWIYEWAANDVLRITKTGSSVFYAFRCDSLVREVKPEMKEMPRWLKR